MRKAGRERETVRDAVTRCPGELPPALHKPLKNKKQKTYPPLYDLRPSPPPPFALFRAQEFPALPPKPLKVLPKPKEEKKFLNSGAFKTRLHAQYTERAPWKKPPQGGLTQAKKKTVRGFSNNINP